MEGIIKVSPELLISTASTFNTQGQQLSSLTTQMLDLANSLTGLWQGEAATAYMTKFRGLQDDMTKMYRMVQEHSTDLQEMAQAYQQAENINAEAAQALNADVII